MSNNAKKLDEPKTITKTFRADQETIDKLQTIAEDCGNQGIALRHLVELYELEQVRRVLPGSIDMIDAFEKNVDGIKNAFLYALELKTIAEENAKDMVRKQIEVKDQTISDLQFRINESKSEVERLNAELQTQVDQQSHLLDRVGLAEKAAQKLEGALIDKEKILALQEKEIEALNNAITHSEEIEKELFSLRSEANAQAECLKATENEKASLSGMLDKVRKEYERDLSFAAKEAESERRAAIVAIREELQTKIDTYISKIEAKDDEIAQLKAEIVDLKLKNTKKETSKCKAKEKTSTQ